MTELIWDGKYDKEGRRIAPLRIALPFQTVETVNESAQERQRTLDFFSVGRDPEWRNRLIWGDKKYVLPSLLPEFAGKVDLIYIDPPFDTGADFSYQVEVDGESFTKEPSIIEQKAYRDTWGQGLHTYLQWVYHTALLLRELLADDGSLYVHVGQNVSHYIKVVLDEVFGEANYVNEIVWKRHTAHSDARQGAKHYGRVHDCLLFYSKTDGYIWNQLYTPYDPQYLATHYKNVDPSTGRRYELDNITAPGGAAAAKGNPYYEFLGVTRYWRFSRERMNQLYNQGQIVQPSPLAVPRQKRYLDEVPGLPLQSMWTDINPINSQAKEAVGYPTQKPESLLDRVVKVSSREGDLVLDCFCGSGTTVAVAEKLGRRWIAADLGRFAVHSTRKRLLSIPDVKPFVVQNLGKYERQAWQVAEFGEEAETRMLAYRRFMLDLYKAKPISGYTWLHGLKAGRLVHIGSVDAPISPGDVTQIAGEFRRAMGTGTDAPTNNGVDVLGWDFAFELHEVAQQQAALANIDVRFVRVPREVLEKRAVEQGDIRFFELAALAVNLAKKGRAVTLTLSDFVIPPDDVPEEVRRAVSNWVQWIDYWAVDWDNREDTFHNEWQTYRTRQSRELQKSVSHTYEQPGTYKVVVKVIDLLGNDTTKTLVVEVS
ncbi:MAG: DNA methyltransferase [Chloroflexota bacterium]